MTDEREGDGESEGRPIESVIPPGVLARRGTVLVAGPTAETLGAVPEGLLAAGATDGDGVVAVTTRESAASIAGRIAGLEPFAADRIAVVDCTRRGWDRSRVEGTVRAVDSPSDLTGTGIALDEAVDDLAAGDVGRAHVLFDSLSAPLRSVPAETVLRFVHHLTIEVGILTGLNVHPVYTNVVDDRDLAMLQHLFEGMVEVRKRNGDRDVRCRGLRGTPDGWVTVSPPDSGSNLRASK